MIPTYQQIEDPLLRLLHDDSPMALRDAISRVADHFGMTPEERTSSLPSGRRTYVADRTAWAATYLAKAGLVSRPKRGTLPSPTGGDRCSLAFPRGR